MEDRPIETGAMSTILKTSLIKRGWGDAIELLDCLIRLENKKYKKWLKTKSTLDLRAACERFRNWSIYDQRKGPLPFDNDVYALDTIICNLKD